MQRKVLLYDKSGEEHFNLISALHKSVRSSDPDAALYWLTRMLEAGEDRLYIARRLVRMAIEDIGLADPRALEQCIAVKEAVHFLGIPEGDLALAQAAIYLCVAPKSDAAYRALGAVKADVEKTIAEPVPMHLRNAPTKSMKQWGYGEGYQHAHKFEDADSRYGMPAAVAGRKAILFPDGSRRRKEDSRAVGRDTEIAGGGEVGLIGSDTIRSIETYNRAARQAEVETAVPRVRYGAARGVNNSTCCCSETAPGIAKWPSIPRTSRLAGFILCYPARRSPGAARSTSYCYSTSD